VEVDNHGNKVKKEKAVYDTLNMLNFDVTKKCLVGEGWCPIFAKSQIKDCLQRATFHSNSQVGIIFHEMDTLESPPTYFRTDKFTNAFQEIVDAYGYVQRCQSHHEREILPVFQIVCRYITKTMHLEMLKRPIIWNRVLLMIVSS